MEDNLNSHNSDLAEMLSAMLNIMAKNQALMETMIELQLNFMGQNTTPEQFAKFVKDVHDNADVRLAQIQAKITSEFRGE